MRVMAIIEAHLQRSVICSYFLSLHKGKCPFRVEITFLSMLHHFFLALLAVLLPVIIVEGPQLQSKLNMGISGSYDVLVLAFLLPKEQVLQLLPASSQGHLLPVPEDVLSSLSSSSTSTAEQHPVLLQMGYQISTGPGPSWLPKFSFNECKLEVPFIRHPSGKSDAAYTLKQTM
jgi:hypothetical protein